MVEQAGQAIDAHLDVLAHRLGAGPGEDAIVVVNPDLSARPLRVTLPAGVAGAQPVAGGSVLTAARSVAGLEAAIVRTGAPAGALDVTPEMLENDLVRVALAPDGTIASIWDKRAGREALDGPGNQLWAFVDKPREWDAWEVDATYETQGELLPAPQAVAVVEEGPHRVAVRLERALPRITRRARDPVVGRLGPDRAPHVAGLARPALAVAGALPARRALGAGDLRDRLRRRRACDPPQHALGRGALRGRRTPLRGPVRAGLRRRAPERRPLRLPRARQRARALAAALAVLARSARRRGRAGAHLRAAPALRLVAGGRSAGGSRGPQPPAPGPAVPARRQSDRCGRWPLRAWRSGSAR